MKKIKIIADSASDISYENEKDYDIDVLPVKITMGTRTYLSRIDFDNDEFYKMMEDFGGIPVTSQVTPYEFSDLYEKYFGEGYTDIISISMNSLGSATFSSSQVAAQEFFESQPGAGKRFKIHTIDSGTYSGCLGYAVVEAAKMVRDGAGAEDIVKFVKEWCDRVSAVFVPFTLKYAAKSGRIPVIAAQMGDALGIKPLLKLHDHEIQTVGKTRSEKKIIPEIAKKVLCEMEEGSVYCILYGSDYKARDDAAAYMTEKLGYPPADFYQIGAAVAANAGPRAVGVVYRQKRA